MVEPSPDVGQTGRGFIPAVRLGAETRRGNPTPKGRDSAGKGAVKANRGSVNDGS